MDEITLYNATVFMGLDSHMYILEWLELSQAWILNELVPVYTDCES